MPDEAVIARTPGAKRAGAGEHHFELAKVNHIKGGPDYRRRRAPASKATA
jgi:hypothetical protein